jgi:hypothetical protein
MLTKKQEISLFKVLEVPYATTGNAIVGDNLLAEAHDVTSAARAAKTMILAYVAQNITADAEVQTELTTLLDTYADLGTDVTVIENGSVGDVSGISDSAAAEREEIKRQVLVLVPFYRYADDLMRSRSGNITLIR